MMDPEKMAQMLYEASELQLKTITDDPERLFAIRKAVFQTAVRLAISGELTNRALPEALRLVANVLETLHHYCDEHKRKGNL